MEARIQTRTLPAVGCAALFGVLHDYLRSNSFNRKNSGAAITATNRVTSICAALSACRVHCSVVFLFPSRPTEPRTSPHNPKANSSTQAQAGHSARRSPWVISTTTGMLKKRKPMVMRKQRENVTQSRSPTRLIRCLYR